MKFYVLKCDKGYVKNDRSEGCICVALDKASVFTEANIEKAHQLVEKSANKGMTNVRLVELCITEKEL